MSRDPVVGLVSTSTQYRNNKITKERIELVISILLQEKNRDGKSSKGELRIKLLPDRLQIEPGPKNTIQKNYFMNRT